MKNPEMEKWFSENPDWDFKEKEVTKQEGTLSASRKKNTEIPDLDLHGMTQGQAVSKLEGFLKSQPREVLKVKVIHGKGHHSPDKKSILQESIRQKLKAWKSKNYLVRDFSFASPEQGGLGATIIWLLPR